MKFAFDALDFKTNLFLFILAFYSFTTINAQNIEDGLSLSDKDKVVQLIFYRTTNLPNGMFGYVQDYNNKLIIFKLIDGTETVIYRNTISEINSLENYHKKSREFKSQNRYDYEVNKNSNMGIINNTQFPTATSLGKNRGLIKLSTLGLSFDYGISKFWDVGIRFSSFEALALNQKFRFPLSKDISLAMGLEYRLIPINRFLFLIDKYPSIFSPFTTIMWKSKILSFDANFRILAIEGNELPDFSGALSNLKSGVEIGLGIKVQVPRNNLFQIRYSYFLQPNNTSSYSLAYIKQLKSNWSFGLELFLFNKHNIELINPFLTTARVFIMSPVIRFYF